MCPAGLQGDRDAAEAVAAIRRAQALESQLQAAHEEGARAAAGQAQAPDMLAATMGQDAANMRNWQAQQQANAQLINGLGSLGGSIAGSFFGLGSK